MTMAKNELKILTKYNSCKCKCRFDGRICNSEQWWKNDMCRYECKKRHDFEKDYVWNLTTCSCENRKYLATIMDESAIMYQEVIESCNNEINLNEK